MLKTSLHNIWPIPSGMEEYLKATNLVDLDSEITRKATKEVIHNARTPQEAAVRIFYFVRDKIKYELSPQLEKASMVIERGTGYCVSKSTVMVTMARLAGIPARYHSALIKKEAVKGLMGNMGYNFMQKTFPHTWSELYLDEKWLGAECSYDDQLHEILKTKHINIYEKRTEPEVDWDGAHDLGVLPELIVEDLGFNASPEEFVRKVTLWPLWQYLQNQNIHRLRVP